MFWSCEIQIGIVDNTSGLNLEATGVHNLSKCEKCENFLEL